MALLPLLRSKYVIPMSVVNLAPATAILSAGCPARATVTSTSKSGKFSNAVMVGNPGNRYVPPTPSNSRAKMRFFKQRESFCSIVGNLLPKDIANCLRTSKQIDRTCPSLSCQSK